MANIAERKALPQGFRILSTQAIMLHQAVADMLNLDITDYKCMDLIARLGPMTAGKLAELSGLTTGAITGVVDRLDKAGYAKRTDNPKDRRSVIIELTWNKKNTKRIRRNISPVRTKNRETGLFLHRRRTFTIH